METQLCATIHNILAGTVKDQSVHAAVLEFTKAFDRVPYALLMEKLSKIKTIDEYLLRWNHNFLLDRSHCVILIGKKFKSLLVTSGVPQGSVLGLYYFSCLSMTYQKW